MNVDRSRNLGRALMAVSAASLLLFLAGAARRSYLALAVPVAAGLAIVAGLGFWVGYTMATTRWDEEFDELEVEAAEGAPPPESLAR